MSAPTLPAPASLDREPETPLAAGLGPAGRAWRANPPLALVGLASLALLVPFVAAIFLDPQVITGAPAWLKPAKFAISIAIYTLTLVWFLSYVQGHRRLVAAIAWGTAAAFLVEIAIIAAQAARGTTSHFNDATPLDLNLFIAMGVSVGVIALLAIVAAVLLLRQRVVPPALAMALRLGLIGTVIGMLQAVPMFGDLMGHAVGVADGGPGLPILGWSTEGGDLRAGHFVGLHAMQALPLVGFALVRFAPRWLGAGRQSALVGVAGGVWIGTALLMTWQALRGQSVVAPDATTLVAAGGLISIAVAVVGLIVLPARAAGRAGETTPFAGDHHP